MMDAPTDELLQGLGHRLLRQLQYLQRILVVFVHDSKDLAMQHREAPVGCDRAQLYGGAADAPQPGTGAFALRTLLISRQSCSICSLIIAAWVTPTIIRSKPPGHATEYKSPGPTLGSTTAKRLADAETSYRPHLGRGHQFARRFRVLVDERGEPLRATVLARHCKYDSTQLHGVAEQVRQGERHRPTRRSR